jgi:cytoskeleton protein RodZ
MADNTEKPAPEDNTPREENSAPRATAGQLLRAARTRAGLTTAKVSADLRISPSILEALESGDYGRLAGAPYIRALLVSLSRYLRIEPKDVLQAYAEETGSHAATVTPVSPYKDDSKTHAKAHKQIFILLLAVLLFVLLLIMGKVSSSSPEETEPEAAPASSDTLLNIDPLIESDSLNADSLSLDSAAADTIPLIDTATMASAAAPANTAALAKPEAAPAKETTKEAVKEPVEPKQPTTVRVAALSDSVYIRVIRAGKRESSRVLAPGQAIELKHSEAITFITRNSSTVEVTVGSTVVVPDKRRFKVSGGTIAY